MRAVLDEFEEATADLALQLTAGDSYLERFSDSRDVFQEIQTEDQEIQQLREEQTERAKVLSMLRQKEATFILDHPYFPVRQLREQTSQLQLQEGERLGFLNVNHQLVIEVLMGEIEPLIRREGNLSNELSFESLKFHLHYLDEVSSSRTLRYSPQHNLYHTSQVVGGKMMKSNREFTLRVEHKVRSHNILLYSELSAEQPVTLVAESTYGSIIGCAEIDLSSFEQSGKPIQRQFISLLFRKKGEVFGNAGVFSAKVYLTVHSTPIAPELEELIRYAQMDSKLRPHSRSPTPTRVVSKSPQERSSSPKVKRKMMRHIVKGPERRVELSVFDGREYRYGVDSVNPTLSRELVYRKLVNVKEKKVELIKVQGSYYLKFLLRKDTPEKAASITFGFNEIDFEVKIRNNSLFQTLSLSDYEEIKSPGKKTLQNKVVYLGAGEQIYARPNHRIFKNVAGQTVEDGLLGSVFVKSPLPKCQIFCSKPFALVHILHKEDGYIVTYCYEGQPVQEELFTTLVFYVQSISNQMKDAHVFDCTVRQRIFSRQILSKELVLTRGEAFCKLGMKMIAVENHEYTVRSSEPDKLIVVNGTPFCYENHRNQSLVLQVLLEADSGWEVDLIFHDSKGRSFFLKLLVCPPSPDSGYIK